MSKRFVFLSYYGESLPIALRLRAEGADAKVYVHSPLYANVYRGTDLRIEARDLQREINRSDQVVFDNNRAFEDTPEDRLLAGMFGLTERKTLFGEIADKIKPGVSTMGASKKAFELEKTRDAPPQSRQQQDGDIPFSVEGWYDGKWKCFMYIIEDSTLMNGNLGMSVGSQGNIVWSAKSTVLDNLFSKAAEVLGPDQYTGAFRVNAIASRDGDIKFAGWQCRFSFDALYAVLTLARGSLGKYFLDGYTPGLGYGYAATQRITVPPYPYRDPELMAMADGAAIGSELPNSLWAQDIFYDDRQFKCAGTDGVLGVMAAQGQTIGKAASALYADIGRLQPDIRLQYRTDAGRKAESSIKLLKSRGIDIRGN